MIEEYLTDNTIMITPQKCKLEILKKYVGTLKDIKFMTKEEFFSKYYFAYDERAYFYLQKKYHLHLDVCKLYLKNLYFIEDKTYQSEKLNRLKKIKKELEKEKLLDKSPLFRNYIADKKIIVYHYNELEKYEENVLEALSALILKEDAKYSLPEVVREAKTLEEEVVYIATEIRKLRKKSIPFSHIYLLNVKEEYYYPLTHIFSAFQIPLGSLSGATLYGTEVVSNYLKTGTLDLKNKTKQKEQVVSVINSLASLEEGETKTAILIDKLRHTKLIEEEKEDCVTVASKEDIFTEEDYVFLLGMNQELFPSLKQDDDFILDEEKEEVELFTTDEKNQRIKEEAENLLRRIPNLYLSYKLESPFQTFYKSSFIEEKGIKVEKIKNRDYHYSNHYNKILLAEKLDDYDKYGTIGEDMNLLYATYPTIPYHSYDSKFTGVNKHLLKEYLSPSLHLSYTHLQNYYLCGFKYYINHILHLDPYQSTFSSIIGNMFHEALRYMECADFDLDYFFARFLEAGEFSPKEEFFLKLLKKDLKKTLTIIEEQKEYTKFKDKYLEKTLELPCNQDSLKVLLKGTIDKIMYYNNISDTYYAVIDYKSGSFDTDLSKIEFGLNMQLPIYLYLIEKSRLFQNSIFTGFYYQKLLLPKKTFETEEETLKLEGYSCEDPMILEKFDNSYQKSELIKGLAIKQDGTFSARSKLLSIDDIESLLQKVEEKVLEARDDILEGKFTINPKYLNKENISCKYCKYHDLCFMTEKDLVYLSSEKN